MLNIVETDACNRLTTSWYMLFVSSAEMPLSSTREKGRGLSNNRSTDSWPAWSFLPFHSSFSSRHVWKLYIEVSILSLRQDSRRFTWLSQYPKGRMSKCCFESLEALTRFPYHLYTRLAILNSPIYRGTPFEIPQRLFTSSQQLEFPKTTII